jgi:hypothetical protein
MTSIDKLLTQIIDNDTTIHTISLKDSRILKGLAKSVSSSNFITENQGRLLIKIFRENADALSIDLNMLDYPTWSHSFRLVDKTKKLYILDSYIWIEYTFSSSINKVLSNLPIVIATWSNRLFSTPLSERNIVILVESLSKLGFELDDQIKMHYDTISSWSKDEIVNQYQLTTNPNANFQRHLVNDVTFNTCLNQNTINDRSIRYQYSVERNEKPTTLTEIIANRKQPKIWIDNQKYTINDIVQSLIELRRLPILFVFDAYQENDQLLQLTQIADALDLAGITSNIGIYFRFSNLEGKEFNNFIAQRQYNCMLDIDTKVAGVNSGKIPKFFINNEWTPMSVVSINTSLRYSKTAIYANRCDLIIAYTTTEPIIEMRAPWE